MPATGPENISQIRFNPKLDRDGTYKLIVQARDLSNNASGDHDYEIEFEVVMESTITDVLNYPNPFTTSTRFVFTVTGTEAPDYMKIQIMTISGRVVREITNDELGELRVGKNMTEYAWDGRDQFGDRLARGVYLYRVIARLNGEDIKYRESSASPYFKKGIGKMYLLN
jgi:flagellar hook assembly protein FlgD